MPISSLKPYQNSWYLKFLYTYYHTIIRGFPMIIQKKTPQKHCLYILKVWSLIIFLKAELQKKLVEEIVPKFWKIFQDTLSSNSSGYMVGDGVCFFKHMLHKFILITCTLIGKFDLCLIFYISLSLPQYYGMALVT